ncbi:Complement component 1 Q subcomponent-binding protein, mitochondrial [Halocaridina rubra]|uniref:Complement component 1 Q subcomponent-binding protein, mitochondrial n=1 Tax=Halocaridina rubra TaxID=373956 RepID=A0AAN8WT92_HALRR
MSIFSRAALWRVQKAATYDGWSCLRGCSATSRPFRRSLVVLSANSSNGHRPHKVIESKLCSCGCGIHGIHTRGDRELVEFLKEEIAAEKRNMTGSLPSHIDDFTVKAKDAELTLTKSFHDELITISLNVNHTVDSEGAVEGTQEVNLKSRPSFEVDIKVGSKIMSFTCSYVNPGDALAEGQDQGEDTFGINELTVYEGEWTEETYCVSGDIMDGMMYDLLMNMLEERGISNEFAEKLSTLCSDYEHSKYIALLQNVQNFVKRS